MKGFLIKKTTAKVNFLLERQGKKEKRKKKNRRKITEIKAREKDWYTGRKRANQKNFLTLHMRQNVK